MNRVRVVTDSTSDVPPEVAEKLGIVVVPAYVQIGDQSYRDEPTSGGLSRKEFYELGLEPSERYCCFEHKCGPDRTVGSISGVVQNGVLRSGFRASYGGFDFMRKRENFARVDQAVGAAMEQAKGAGVSEVLIKGKPQCYSDNEPLIHMAMVLSPVPIDRGPEISIYSSTVPVNSSAPPNIPSTHAGEPLMVPFSSFPDPSIATLPLPSSNE